jgi:DNA-binding NarL/FixJ family response regulator
VFEKLSIKECRVTITEGKYKLKPRVLKDVSPTSLKYSPDQLAWFDLDLDLNDLFTYTASLPEGSEQWSTILSYVKAHAGESVNTLDPKQVAVWLKQRGQSEREIASLVGRSNSTVHEWVSTSAEK